MRIPLPVGRQTLTDLLFMLIVCGVLFFFGTHSYRLIDIDEPHYAETAREMIELKSWVTPYFNYQLRFDKPALFYWLIILSYQVFGVTEFAARAVSGSLATLLTLALYFFGTYLVSRRVGLLAALISATSLMTVGLARMAITDMTLCVFIALTTLSLYLVSQSRHQNPKIWWLAAGFFSAMACLTKGPVGIVIPGCVFLLYSVFRKEFRQNFLTPWFLSGLLTWFLFTFPWYYLTWLENGQIFIDALIHHNMGRYTGRIIEHQYPWYFYFVVVLIGFLPWSVFLPASIRQRYAAAKSAQPDDKPAATNLAFFALVWFGFIFVFFSFAQTKLLTYIISLFPALALWMAVYLDRAAKNKTEWRWLSRSALVLAMAATIMTLGAAFQVKQLFPSDIHNIIRNPAYTLLNVGLCAILTAVLWGFRGFLRRGKVLPAVATVCVGLALFVVCGIYTWFPHIKVVAKQNTLYNYTQKTQDAPLATYQLIQPSLTFYAQRPVDTIEPGDKQALIRLAASHPDGVYLVTSKKYLEHFEENRVTDPAFQWRLIDRGKRYSLLMLKPSASP